MEYKVFITTTEATCNECGEKLGRGAWIMVAEEKGALCLDCADLDHLLYLPSGDPALTRRAHKHSTLYAVVLKWSRARKRYERQGIMVEASALEKAEQECLEDRDVRLRRKERETTRRAELDHHYVAQFSKEVRKLFPGCPRGQETIIAEHACLKYSGRVGRSAAAKSLDENAIRLAVIAHIRHVETEYDQLLANGCPRRDARQQVADAIKNVLDRWSAAK